MCVLSHAMTVVKTLVQSALCRGRLQHQVSCQILSAPGQGAAFLPPATDVEGSVIVKHMPEEHQKQALRGSSKK